MVSVDGAVVSVEGAVVSVEGTVVCAGGVVVVSAGEDVVVSGEDVPVTASVSARATVHAIDITISKESIAAKIRVQALFFFITVTSVLSF